MGIRANLGLFAQLYVYLYLFVSTELVAKCCLIDLKFSHVNMARSYVTLHVRAAAVTSVLLSSHQHIPHA